MGQAIAGFYIIFSLKIVEKFIGVNFLGKFDVKSREIILYGIKLSKFARIKLAHALKMM